MGEKYFSDIEGYKDLFIEVSDAWLMKEVKEMADADEVTYFEYFNKKVDAMYLRDSEGVEFTNPKTFSVADVDNFDVSLAGFIGSILSTHIRRRKSLGGLSVRTLPVGSVGVEQTKKK